MVTLAEIFTDTWDTFPFDFLANRHQVVVKVRSRVSPLGLSTGAPPGRILSLLHLWWPSRPELTSAPLWFLCFEEFGLIPSSSGRSRAPLRSCWRADLSAGTEAAAARITTSPAVSCLVLRICCLRTTVRSIETPHTARRHCPLSLIQAGDTGLRSTTFTVKWA